MTAVLIPAANEAEWLAARRAGVTASEIAVVMGLSPWSSPYALYCQKTGDLPGQEDDMAMAIGRHFESFVSDQFAMLHDEFHVTGDGRTLYAHPERPWQLATPDRIVNDVRFDMLPGVDEVFEEYEPYAVLECKTDGAFDGWGEDGTDEIPVHYRCQVLWQMDVLGVGAAFVACLFMNRRQLRVYELAMDDHARADLDLMRAEAHKFLARIENREPPDVDWRPATSAALKQLHPDVADVDVSVKPRPVIQYRAACKAFKAAEERKRLAENRLRLLLGSGHRITDERTGEVIARRDVYDVKEHVRKGCHVDKLVPIKPRGSSS